jgi:hypothetical protein
VALTNAGAGTLTGTIIGVERQRQSVNKEAVEQPVLNLWCADGMRSVKLADVQRVRFLIPAIDTEFKKALETLARSHDTQKKTVSVRFAGEGKRRVTVGYVVESPVWKTSYRLVLPRKAGEKPYLQGWAVVENTTDEDWKGVRMTLVSGRPISFQMDLYQPLYATRPVVIPELFQGLQSVAYEGSLTEDADKKPARVPPADRVEEQVNDASVDRREQLLKRIDRAERANRAVRGAISRDDLGAARAELERLSSRLDLGKSIASAANAAKLGDFFQYALDRPVTLARQKSALLPIVGKDVEATRVSIYNERVQAKFPLLGLRLKNTTGVHLMQGPITVFEGSSYAGDAQVKDLQPGEQRLVSYAIDLGTEVSPAPAQSNGRITQLKVDKGVLTSTTKTVETRVYTVKNRNDQERTLLIEHPVRHEFKLVDCKPAETAADVYRFELKVPAGGTKALAVHEEQTVAASVAISSQADEQVRLFLGQKALSEKVKQGLLRALELRAALAKTAREVAEQRGKLDAITKDQERLRANLKEMPSTAKAYKRYVEKFDEQETQIERLQAAIEKLEEARAARQRALDDFLAAFTAE